LLVAFPSAASPAATLPELGAAASFSVLAASSAASANMTILSGDLGLSPGLAVSRTGPWTVGGTEYFGPLSLAATAQTDALGAFNNLAGQFSDGVWSASPWSPLPGVWTAASDTTFAGTITLSGGYNDVWVFQVGGDMTFTGVVSMTGGAQACNVFWQIGRDATIAVGSTFVGTLIASRDVTLVSGATVDGRIISLNRDLTTDGNRITGPTCAQPMQSITTQIHDATHAVVTSAPIGTIVHDMATVTGTIGIPTPTGTVTFTVYANQTCAGGGTPAGAVALVAGVADPSNTATLTDAGLSYLAHYSGDRNYDAADGPCEVLVVTPTAVELLYFQANPLSGQQVQLKWATALEVDNFGFNLYRANVNDLGRASLIHFEAAVTQGSGSGATYVYIDTAPYAGPWWYWLSDVDTYGRETFHDTPINITVQSSLSLPYHVYFPFIAKGSGN
jgi:hypothetical protein